MTADLAIKGGTVVSAGNRRRANVYVAEGRIVAIGDSDEPATDTVDATGLFVLPGMVDTHVHLMDPGDTAREDFPRGTSAAAAAGVTTIIEHTHSNPIRTVTDLEEKKGYLHGRSNVDFGLAAHTWPDHLGGLEDLWAAGIGFFKIFTCATHGVPGLERGNLREALATIAAFGGISLVHCEDQTITSEARTRLLGVGRSDNAIIPEWRSERAELVAVSETCRLIAEVGAKATIAHISQPAAADVVHRARSRGADVAAETCPQYLGLRRDEVLTEGPFRKFTPPARAVTDEDEALMWALIRADRINHIATDHAPSTREQKAVGIWDAPFGLPGLDTTMPFLIDAVHRGHLELEDVVRVYAEAPAKRYGLFPRKGRLGIGSDADVVLISTGGAWQVSDGDIHSKAGWSPFSGRTLHGRVVATYLGGRPVASNRVPSDERLGRFVPGAGLKAA